MTALPDLVGLASFAATAVTLPFALAHAIRSRVIWKALT